MRRSVRATEPGIAPETASTTDWLETVRQSLPKLLGIIRHLKPVHELGGLAELDEDFLRRHGIRGLVWDVDGTMTHYHGVELAPEVAVEVKRLLGTPGLRHAIVSNSDEIRYRELGRMFPAVPVLKLYQANGKAVGRRLESGKDSLKGAAAGLGGLSPVRKPSDELMRFAAAELGLEPGQVAMVGDQYWTDVAGANLAGLQSIRIATIGRGTFPLPIRVMQRVEGWMRRILG
jgi:HAD superfamily phosphatase (TIGR01668 family)